jgi:hypothetical protein
MGSGGVNPLGGGVCRDDHEPDRRYGPDMFLLYGLASSRRSIQNAQVPGPREIESKLIVVAQDVINLRAACWRCAR